MVLVRFSPQAVEQFRRADALLAELDPEGEPRAVVFSGEQPHGRAFVFPSSFNPPTTAHLALLRQAQVFAQQHGWKDSCFYAAISKQIVDKERVQRPLILDRVVLLEDVLRQQAPGVGVMLFNRGLYVEQAQAVHDNFPAVTQLYFLVGFDKILQIFDPRYYKDRDAALRELFELAQILVAPRGEAGASDLQALLERPENRPFARYVHALPFDPAYRAVSSTAIREDPQGHPQDIPPEVRHFIAETHVYEQPRPGAPDLYGERIQAIAALLKKDVSPGM